MAPSVGASGGRGRVRNRKSGQTRTRVSLARIKRLLAREQPSSSLSHSAEMDISRRPHTEMVVAPGLI